MELLNSNKDVICKPTKDGKYVIYSDGRIYSNVIKRFKKPTEDKDGYYKITLNNKSFRLEIESNLNINNFISLLNKDINLSGYIDFIYDNEYKINANINILYDKICTNINIKYDNEFIYINALGLNIKINISKDDIINKAFDVIDTLLLINDNSISINLNSLFDKLSVLTIILINDNENYSLNLNMDILNCEIKIKEINNYDLVYSDDYLGYDDILNLCNMVSKILNISKNKEFNLNLDFSVYD